MKPSPLHNVALLGHEGRTARRTESGRRRLKPNMATQGLSERRLSDRRLSERRITLDRSETAQRGSIGFVLLVALVIVGAAVALLFIDRGRAEPYIVGLLAILATVGVFSLFAFAAGLLRFFGKGGGAPLI